MFFRFVRVIKLWSTCETRWKAWSWPFTGTVSIKEVHNIMTEYHTSLSAPFSMAIHSVTNGTLAMLELTSGTHTQVKNLRERVKKKNPLSYLHRQMLLLLFYVNRSETIHSFRYSNLINQRVSDSDTLPNFICINNWRTRRAYKLHYQYLYMFGHCD